MIEQARSLYALDPALFTAARNQLVKELKAAKRKDDAAVVAKLSRPRLGEYVLNQIARDQPDVVKKFADAVVAATAAQSNAIGGGDGAGLRSTSSDLRAASAGLVEAAVKRLRRDDRDTPARRDEILSTVRASTNEAATAQLVAGVVGSQAAGEADLFAGAPEPAEIVERPAKRVAPPKRKVVDDAVAEPQPKPQPKPPSSAELARRKKAAAQLDRAKAALSVARREVVAAQRAIDAATARQKIAQHEHAQATAALETLERGT